MRTVAVAIGFLMCAGIAGCGGGAPTSPTAGESPNNQSTTAFGFELGRAEASQGERLAVRYEVQYRFRNTLEQTISFTVMDADLLGPNGEDLNGTVRIFLPETLTPGMRTGERFAYIDDRDASQPVGARVRLHASYVVAGETRTTMSAFAQIRPHALFPPIRMQTPLFHEGPMAQSRFERPRSGAPAP